MDSSGVSRGVRIVMAGLVLAVFFLSGYYVGTFRTKNGGVRPPASVLNADPTGGPVSATSGAGVLGTCLNDAGEKVTCLTNSSSSVVVPVSPSDVADFNQFWKAWNVINEKYVPTKNAGVSERDKVWGAISGLANSLGDPYTYFLPPAEKTIFEQDVQGNFGGVGMQIGMKDGFVTVIAPLKGSPAERAGVKEGDKVILIDGATTTEMTMDKALSLIRGEVGKPVTLTLARTGLDKPLVVKIIREIIQVPTIDTKLVDGVFVISLYGFPATGADLFRQALREFSQSGTDKLILDLRGNPGGYLEVAVDMASWFLPPGKTVVSEEEKGGQGRVFRSKGYNVFGDNFRFVILVDGGSASAAEILAGALSENGVATLVGTRTFGKGSVQELIPITPETSLKLTVARWITPNGTNLSAGGIVPDVVVTISETDIEKGNDPQMKKAIEVVKGLK